MNIKIRYIKGKENVLSDYISRNIAEEKTWKILNVNAIEFNYNSGFILQEQLNDDEIILVKQYLHSKDSDVPKIYKRHLSRVKIEQDKLVFANRR